MTPAPIHDQPRCSRMPCRTGQAPISATAAKTSGAMERTTSMRVTPSVQLWALSINAVCRRIGTGGAEFSRPAKGLGAGPDGSALGDAVFGSSICAGC